MSNNQSIIDNFRTTRFNVSHSNGLYVFFFEGYILHASICYQMISFVDHFFKWSFVLILTSKFVCIYIFLIFDKCIHLHKKCHVLNVSTSLVFLMEEERARQEAGNSSFLWSFLLIVVHSRPGFELGARFIPRSWRKGVSLRFRSQVHFSKFPTYSCSMMTRCSIEFYEKVTYFWWYFSYNF